VPCLDPAIVIRPEAGPPGYTAFVEGTDFPPSTTVMLTWDRGIDAGRPVEVLVDDLGGFSLAIFILPNDFAGRALTAGRHRPPGLPERHRRVHGTRAAAYPRRGRVREPPLGHSSGSERFGSRAPLIWPAAACNIHG
jgi:hypothetical protein